MFGCAFPGPGCGRVEDVKVKFGIPIFAPEKMSCHLGGDCAPPWLGNLHLKVKYAHRSVEHLGSHRIHGTNGIFTYMDG